jgi:hypothetical protein
MCKEEAISVYFTVTDSNMGCDNAMTQQAIGSKVVDWIVD